jgi:hypothetical protein
MNGRIGALALILAAVTAQAHAQEAVVGGDEQGAQSSLPMVGYDKGFFIRTEDSKFELKIGARVHAVYAYNSIDKGQDVARDQQQNFSISTARLNLKGKAFIEGLGYTFEADFGKGFVKLLDFYADYAFIPQTLHLRAGLWKHPFSRPFITSSGKAEMVERNIASQYFGEGYDIGLALHNNYEKSPTFEWVVGLFNGYTADKPWFTSSFSATADQDGKVIIDTSKGSFTNVPIQFSPALVARVGYNYNGIDGYSEADLEGGPLRFAVAANLMVNFDYDNANKSAIRSGIDFVLKAEGLSFSGAFYHTTAQKKQATNGPGTSFTDQESKAAGLYAQAGYLISKHYQPVVRYSLIVQDGNKSTQELSAGVSIYFVNHNFKWQTFFAALVDSKALGGTKIGIHDYIDYQVRSQVVFSF